MTGSSVKIQIRSVTREDCRMLFNWRNHYKVRQYCINNKELDYTSHTEWFNNSIQNENLIMLIGVCNSEDVGMIRYDLFNNKQEAEVSIYIKPDKHGKGLGAELLYAGEEWLKQHQPLVKRLKAKVLEQNVASIKLFHRTGFSSDYIIFSKEIGR
jgi:RimJ/RimL family protein N-acetyltransferase